MIRYALKCSDGHGFESWFQSAGAYDTLAARGLVTCVTCGTADVTKALMAPKIGGVPAIRTPPSEVERRLTALRVKVEAEATYVGGRFAAEARAIHETGGDRQVYGEANGAEVRALIEDGVPVAPLPFLPKSKAN